MRHTHTLTPTPAPSPLPECATRVVSDRVAGGSHARVTSGDAVEAFGMGSGPQVHRSGDEPGGKRAWPHRIYTAMTFVSNVQAPNGRVGRLHNSSLIPGSHAFGRIYRPRWRCARRRLLLPRWRLELEPSRQETISPNSTPDSVERSTIRLAVPSKGDMHRQTLDLLRECGLEVDVRNPRQYMAGICNFPGVELWFQRPADIVHKVKDGTLDVGVVGHDLVAEYNVSHRG